MSNRVDVILRQSGYAYSGEFMEDFARRLGYDDFGAFVMDSVGHRLKESPALIEEMLREGISKMERNKEPGTTES